MIAERALLAGALCVIVAIVATVFVTHMQAYTLLPF